MTRGMLRRRRNVGLGVLLFATVGSVLLLWPYALRSFVYTGDLRDVHLPIEDFYRRELRQLRLPLWDPKPALGFPVLASAQMGFWYPPLAILRALPPEPALAVALVAHLAFLALGTSLFARSLGLSHASALLAATAFTGSGFVIGRLPQANVVFAIAWLPWILLLTDRLADSLRGRTALGLAVVLSLAALVGHFQVTFILSLALAGRLLVRLRQTLRGAQWQHVLWTWLLCLLLLMIGVGILTAAQLFPTLELVRMSTRGLGGGFDIGRANQHSFPPWQILSFVVPSFFGFPDLSEYWGTRPLVEMASWIGALPLLLTVVGALGSRKREPRNAPHFWTATVVVGFLLALGRWSPFRWAGLEPTLSIFSAPARYLVLSEFALAILAGLGLERLRSSPRQRSIMVAGAAGMVAALLILVSFSLVRNAPQTVRNVGLAFAHRFIVNQPGHVLPPEAYAQKIDTLLRRVQTWGVNIRNPLVALPAGVLGVGGVILLLLSWGILKTKNARWLPASVVVLTLGELSITAWRVHPRVPWSEVTRPSPVVSALEGKTWGRLLVIHPQGDTGLLFANPTTVNRDEHERLLRDLAVANMFTRSGLSGIEWPAALDLATSAQVLDRTRDTQGRPVNEGVLDRLSVRYVAGSTATPGLRLRPPVTVITRVPSGEGTMITAWERPTSRPRVEVLADRPAAIETPLPPVAGYATILAEQPQHVRIAVSNARNEPAWLVLRDSHYPGWTATVDGMPSQIQTADTLFRAVRIPTGQHTVQFSYRPRTAWTGLAVSAAGWFVVVVLTLRRRPLGTV